jgi:hypothetical protein
MKDGVLSRRITVFRFLNVDLRSHVRKQSLGQAMRLVEIAKEERTEDHEKIGKAADLCDQVNNVVHLAHTDDSCWIWLNLDLKQKAYILILNFRVDWCKSCFTC